MSGAAKIGRILGQGASVAATRVALIGLSFVSSVLVARVLSIEDRGLFGLLMAAGMLAVQFGNLGLPVANTYLIARQRSLLPGIISNTARFYLAVVVALLVFGAVAICVVPSLKPLQGSAGLAAWAVAIFGVAQLLVQNLLVGQFQFSVSNGVDLTARLGVVLIMLGCVWAGASSASAFGMAAAGAALLATLWGWRRGGLTLPFQAWHGPLAREQMRLGARAYAACVASFALSRVPLYAIETRGGLRGLAYFTQALVVTDTMLVLPVALGTVIFPHLAALADTRARIRTTVRLALGTAALMVAAALFAAWVAPWILPAVYGAPYAATVPYLRVMLPGVVAMGICSVTQNALSANGYPWSAVGAPLSGLLGAVVTLLLRPEAIGCAWSFTCGSMVMLVFSTLAWWHHRHDWEEIAPAPPTDGATGVNAA
ncbi:MAG TPA: hypothetical protein VHD32_05470 [Candidatus Didemnitutus sp.]|nr:hypothetical protein [Candidatus Didemnitutus sp.]